MILIFAHLCTFLVKIVQILSMSGKQLIAYEKEVGTFINSTGVTCGRPS